MENITVLGAGAWGTALAHIAAGNGKNVTLWARETEVVDGVNKNRRNGLFLPDVLLNENVTATNDLSRAVEKTDAVLMVTPA